MCVPCAENCLHCTQQAQCTICKFARKYDKVRKELMNMIMKVEAERSQLVNATSVAPPYTSTFAITTSTLVRSFADWPAGSQNEAMYIPPSRRRRKRMFSSSQISGSGTGPSASGVTTNESSIRGECVSSTCGDRHFLWRAPRNATCLRAMNISVQQNGKERDPLDCRVQDDLCLPCDSRCREGCSWFGNEFCIHCKYARLYFTESQVLLIVLIVFKFTLIFSFRTRARSLRLQQIINSAFNSFYF